MKKPSDTILRCCEEMARSLNSARVKMFRVLPDGQREYIKSHPLLGLLNQEPTENEEEK